MIRFDKDYHKPGTVLMRKQSGERLLFVWKISADLITIWAGSLRDVSYVRVHMKSILCSL